MARLVVYENIGVRFIVGDIFIAETRPWQATNLSRHYVRLVYEKKSY